MWDITGIANPCSLIQSVALPSVRCNWVTTVGGHTGINIPDPDASWEPAITIAGSPRQYLILIDNWNPNYQTTGYTIDWMGSPIATAASAVTWQGSVDTSFSSAVNWGTPPCNATPSCSIDATIATTANGRQPTITSNMAVKNLTINAGATLRIKSPFILDVCGDFTNNGTLIAEPGSTVRFVGTGVQNVNGTLTAANGFANVDITKVSGSVVLNCPIDVTGNFNITNATVGVYNFNGKYMKVGGNYTGYNNASTIGIYGSTVEFNGTANQNYTNTAGVDTLYNVKMNKATGDVLLTGVFGNLNVENILTLLLGNIVTSSTLEVNVKWNNVGAVLSHTVNSFVDGRLRRKLYLGSIDFPVGNSLVPNQGASNGYELANVTFTSSTVVPDLLAWFSLWPGAVPNGPLTPAYYDFCATFTTQYDLLPMLDHGYWTFQRSSPSFNGAYNLTLYNTGGTNATGTRWSIGYAPIAAAPLNQASWALTASCVPTSTMAIDKRNQFNVPAGPGGITSFNHLYSAVQSVVTLPVELLYFTAEPRGEQVVCNWETASETNNEFFEVQRSSNGADFETLGSVRGFGLGTSTENRQYSFIDNDFCDDIRYYRLKQVDYDQQFAYSETVAINCKHKTGIEVYPNPAKTTLTTQFYQSLDSRITISVIDVAGRIVYRENVDGLKGINVVHVNLEAIASGAYYITVTSNENINQTLQSKFFKN